MTADESREILKMLSKAYPRFDMDDDSVRLYQQLLANLDYRIVYRAALEWVKDEKWFPTVADLREYARKTKREVEAETWATKAIATKEQSPPDNEIPEWVQVWWWWKNKTLTARQAANTTTNAAVEDRPPVRMRPFPQEEPLGPNSYTQAEYEQIREQWAETGSPTVTAVEILVTELAP